MKKSKLPKLKTFIKWSGNKSKNLKYIIPHIPKEYNTYIEPFVGSGALLLNLQPNKWIINDINKDLINIWKYVQNDPNEIINNFKKFGKEIKTLSNENKIKYCKALTDTLNKLPYDIYRASIYMLLKYCSFTGNIIVNNEYFFHNLDMNIYINNRYYFLEDNNYNNLLNVSKYINIEKGIIYNEDYKFVLDISKKGDFIFIDPPYTEKDYQFNYNKYENLNNNFLIELRKQLKKLDKKGVKWLMTQSESEDVYNLFKEYDIIKFPVYRAFKKEYVNEIIIKN